MACRWCLDRKSGSGWVRVHIHTGDAGRRERSLVGQTGKRPALLRVVHGESDEGRATRLVFLVHEPPAHKPRSAHAFSRQHNRAPRERGKARHAPEDLHVHVRLEYNEQMRVVVRVNLGARVAQILRAVRAVEPLARDVGHAPVTNGKCVSEFLEVPCRTRETTIVSTEHMVEVRARCPMACGLTFRIVEV